MANYREAYLCPRHDVPLYWDHVETAWLCPVMGCNHRVESFPDLAPGHPSVLN